MQVGYQKETFMGLLQTHPVLKRANQMSQVTGAGGAVSGKNTMGFMVYQFNLLWVDLKQNSLCSWGRTQVRGATPVRLPVKKFPGDAHRGKKPASLVAGTAFMGDTLCPDNGGNSGSDYWGRNPFALQLQGPFIAAVRAGSHRFLLSVPPFRRLLVLFIVFLDVFWKIIMILWHLSSMNLAALGYNL